MFERNDDFRSAVTGLGEQGIDKSLSLIPAVVQWLATDSIDALYVSDGIAANAVDVLPEEALDKGIRISVPSKPEVEDAISDALKRHRIVAKLRRAAKWARKDGGSALLLGIDDGRDASEPIDWANVRAFRWVHVLTRMQLHRTAIDRDPQSPGFGQPIAWRLGGPNIAPIGGAQALVHGSRVIRLVGIELPEETLIKYERENVGFGASVLQRALLAVRNLTSTYQNVATLVQEYHQVAVQIKNLSELLATREEGEALLRSRLRAMVYGRSVMNAIVLDSDEQVSYTTTDLRGIAEVVEHFIRHVSAVTRIPATKLMGQSPDGMNASGEGDAQNWDRVVGAYQETTLREPLEQIVNALMASASGPTRGEVLPFVLTFPPMREMTERETAELRQLQASTDQVYIANAVVEPSEVRSSRFGGQGYSIETTIEEGSEIGAPVEIGEPVAPEEVTTPAPTEAPAPEAGATVQETGLNGAQIASLIEVAAKVASGELAPESALAILAIAFPAVDHAKLEAVVKGNVNAVAPAATTAQ